MARLIMREDRLSPVLKQTRPSSRRLCGEAENLPPVKALPGTPSRMLFYHAPRKAFGIDRRTEPGTTGSGNTAGLDGDARTFLTVPVKTGPNI